MASCDCEKVELGEGSNCTCGRGKAGCIVPFVLIVGGLLAGMIGLGSLFV